MAYIIQGTLIRSIERADGFKGTLCGRELAGRNGRDALGENTGSEPLVAVAADVPKSGM